MVHPFKRAISRVIFPVHITEAFSSGLPAVLFKVFLISLYLSSVLTGFPVYPYRHIPALKIHCIQRITMVTFLSCKVHQTLVPTMTLPDFSVTSTSRTFIHPQTHIRMLFCRSPFRPADGTTPLPGEEKATALACEVPPVRLNIVHHIPDGIMAVWPFQNETIPPCIMLKQTIDPLSSLTVVSPSPYILYGNRCITRGAQPALDIKPRSGSVSLFSFPSRSQRRTICILK